MWSKTQPPPTTPGGQHRWTFVGITRGFVPTLPCAGVTGLLAYLTLEITSVRAPSTDHLITQALMGLMTLAALSVTLMFLCLATGRLLRGYVKITPDGLEYRYWPKFGFHCDWSTVKPQIGNVRPWRFPPWHKNLYIWGPEWFGPTLVISLIMLIWGCDVRETFGYLTLPLWGIRGWPNGEFAHDLRRYAPHLFEAEKG